MKSKIAISSINHKKPIGGGKSAPKNIINVHPQKTMPCLLE